MKILTFTLGSNDFGISLENIEHVEEKANRIAELPNAPAYIKGVATVRDEIVPIYNLALRFGCTKEKLRYLIIVIVDGMKLGFEADRVNRVIDAGENEVFSFPILLNGTQQHFFKNIVIFRQKQLIVQIDVNELMLQNEKEKIHQLMLNHTRN